MCYDLRICFVFGSEYRVICTLPKLSNNLPLTRAWQLESLRVSLLVSPQSLTAVKTRRKLYNRSRITRFPSELVVMQPSVLISYIEQQLAFVMMVLGLLLVHIILKLIHWWVDIFLSQKVTVQLRPLRIPVEHDERGNKANGKEKPFLIPASG